MISSDIRMIQPHEAEIMAPCGSFESLAAAIQGGCDSIYFGVVQLNMRARSADNFSINDISKIVTTCKSENRKTYLAVNTLLYDHDATVMRRIVDSAANEGVDAIIGFDFATIQYCKQIGIPVHISVQFSVSNYESLVFFAPWTNRVVLARELTLDQISTIHTRINRENLLGSEGRLMEIEAFAHGALCVAQSGRCFMSLYTDNSSANRGACRQNCRRQYKITDEETGQEFAVRNHFIMSAADICTLDFLDELLIAGVKVLKIEGRGRGPEYVYTVTKKYKEALSAIRNGQYDDAYVQKALSDLKNVYNRTLSRGNYYLGKENGSFSHTRGSLAKKEKTYVGFVENYFSRVGIAQVRLEAGEIENGNEILVIGSTTGVWEQEVSGIRSESGNPIDCGHGGSVITLKTTKPVHRGDKVYIWKKRNIIQ